MNSFPISADRLVELSATRAGRVALSGYEYQRAFAILRAALMLSRRPMAGSSEVPDAIRYEWAEDLDELAESHVILWQCKLGDGWATATPLAELLVSFAPKWLWTPSAERHRLQLRLVTSDKAHAAHHEKPGRLSDLITKSKVLTAFKRKLADPPSDGSDRAIWQREVPGSEYEALFDGLFQATEVLYMPGMPAATQALWPAEQQALAALTAGRHLADPADSLAIVATLRQLFDAHTSALPDAQGMLARPPNAGPRWLLPVDVAHRLLPHKPVAAGQPLQRIDLTALEWLRSEGIGSRFVARRPQWRDVVRGADPTVGFFERTRTNDLVETLQKALLHSRRGDSGLQVQWVIGAPGTGKSTLTLRAAAQLVLSGKCLVIDARYPLDAEEETEALEAALQDIGTADRPALLLLDDPLSAASGWPALLQRLARKHPAMVALAATPDFLFKLYATNLRAPLAQLAPLTLKRPDAAERHAIAALYPDVAPGLIEGTDDELLVVMMQAAAGLSFEEIVQGIWSTLARHQPLPADTLGRDLPWEVIAFIVVCFCHRAYEPCPLPLLEAILRTLPSVADAAVERLAQLTQAQGWHIFDPRQPTDDKWRYQGGTVGAMHARVAQQAWACRPAMGWQVRQVLAQASVSAPHTARNLGLVLAALHKQSPAEAAAALAAVVTAWITPAGLKADAVRNLCDLVTMLTMNGVPLPADLLTHLQLLADRAEPSSWLPALSLRYLSGSRPAERRWPPTLDLISLIEAADFSLAPNRATRFANAAQADRAYATAFNVRLWAAMKGLATWTLPDTLAGWLISHEKTDRLAAELPAIKKWHDGHPAATGAREAFAGRLPSLSQSAGDQGAADLRQWLLANPADTVVRTAFAGLLPSLSQPARDQGVADLHQWLIANPADTVVRQAFAGLLASLTQPARDQGAADLRQWLLANPADTVVRQAFAGLLASLTQPARDQGAADLRQWLLANPADTAVREAFAGLLASLTQSARDQGVADLRQWLHDNLDDHLVRRAFFGFLSQPDLEDLGVAILDSDIEDALQWLSRHETSPHAWNSVVSLLAARDDARLLGVLKRALAALRSNTQWFTPASSALRAAARLPTDACPTVVAWLAWASQCLKSHSGSPRAHIIATSILGPGSKLRAWLSDGILDAADQQQAVDSLRGLEDALIAWYASVGLSARLPR